MPGTKFEKIKEYINNFLQVTNNKILTKHNRQLKNDWLTIKAQVEHDEQDAEQQIQKVENNLQVIKYRLNALDALKKLEDSYKRARKISQELTH